MCSLFCFKDQTSFFEFTPLYGLYHVERVYCDTSLEVALSSRKSELGMFFEIISKVLNR